MGSLERVAEVLPGHRVEISVPELKEGDRVRVLVSPLDESNQAKQSILTFLDSLPDGPRAFSTWGEYEQHLREERDAWDR